MTAKILCIVPYPGLKTKVQLFFEKMAAENPHLNVKIQIELANLANKRELTNLVKSNYFDLLLSRGGTVDFLKGQTNVPVIDIGISQYDIIRTITSIPDLGKTAIICYDAFNKAIIETLAQFNLKITKFVVKKKIDIKKAMEQLSSKGYKNIICDSGVIASSNNIYHFSSYLIESGDEVVHHAIETCFLLLKEKQKNVNYFELLSESLQAFHNYTLFFARDNYFEVLFSSNKKKTAILAQKVRKAINEHKQLVFFDDASWHLTIKQTDHFSLATLDRLEKNSHYQDKPQRDLNYISSIYSICYDQHFFKLLDYYAGLPTPVCIAGADGLRKTYLSRLIAKKAGKNHLPLIEISLSNHEELEQAITDNSSPFFENNNLVQISGIEKMRQGDLHDFFTFIRKSNLASRNKLVFLISQAYGTKLTVDFPNDLNVNQLFLKPLNEMSYEVFNQLVRSILNDFSLKTGKTFSGVSDTALDLLSSYAWPHNYREFIQVLTTALATATGPILKGKDIEEILDQFSIAEKSRPEQTVDSTHNLETKGQTLHDAIVQIIKDKLKENHGNKTKTALELNISRATLWRYLK